MTKNNNIEGRERTKGTTGTIAPKNKTLTYKYPKRTLIRERITMW